MASDQANISAEEVLSSSTQPFLEGSAGEVLMDGACCTDDDARDEAERKAENADYSGDEDTTTVDAYGISMLKLKGERRLTLEDIKSRGQLKYKMNFSERGCFVIFNQEKFYNGKTTRHGSHMDAINLKRIVQKFLGFTYVRILTDLTKAEIEEWIDKLSKADHSMYDCFACAILTHGGSDGKLYAKDGELNLLDFTQPFTANNCMTLAGKPKLFFVQACEGKTFDKATNELVSVVQADAMSEASDDGRSTAGIPTEADFLIAHATVPGYVSWRHGRHGAWFVQALNLCFEKYHRLEIIEIMTRVNSVVSYFFSKRKNGECFKQMPSITSRLRAELYFRSPTDKGRLPSHSEVDAGCIDYNEVPMTCADSAQIGKVMKIGKAGGKLEESNLLILEGLVRKLTSVEREKQWGVLLKMMGCIPDE